MRGSSAADPVGENKICFSRNRLLTATPLPLHTPYFAATMSIGEKAILEISPEYGYGARGAGGAIPGGATLYFEVELMGLEGGGAPKKKAHHHHHHHGHDHSHHDHDHDEM